MMRSMKVHLTIPKANVVVIVVDAVVVVVAVYVVVVTPFISSCGQ